MRLQQAVTFVFGFAALLATLAAQANPAHDQISSLSEEKRKTVFAALLSRSGEKCPSVSKTFYQGSDKRGNAYWNAACVGGDAFNIQVNNDSTGSTRILSCKVMKAVGGGTCFTKFIN